MKIAIIGSRTYTNKTKNEKLYVQIKNWNIQKLK